MPDFVGHGQGTRRGTLGQQQTVGDSRRAIALAYFVRLVERGGGYLLRGVRGWAHPEDVRLAMRGILWGECCIQLAQVGLLIQELASAPQAATPDFVYRVTHCGIGKYSSFSGRSIAPPPPLGLPDSEPRLYARHGAIWALQPLREARVKRSYPRRVDGEGGWLTAAEIRKPLRDWNDRYGEPGVYRCFDDSTLRGLIVGGLVERQRIKLAFGREAPVVLYRATDAGQTAHLLEWRAPNLPPGRPAEPLFAPVGKGLPYSRRNAA